MTTKTISRGWMSGMLAVMFTAALLLVAGSAGASDPEGATPGPDVVVFLLPNTSEWGENGGIRAYSVGTTSCNRGDTDLEWHDDTNRHPVIAQNLYRVTLPVAGPPEEPSSIEMLGISWLKHGFLSVNGSSCDTCDTPDPPPPYNSGDFLGPGCSDPYGSGLNGSQSRLGPRWQVNAFNGEYTYPYPSPSGHPDLAGRLQVDDSEIVEDPVPPAADVYDFFVEGQYIAPDDAEAGNGMNNASYNEVVVDGIDLDPVGPTFEGVPAIYAWQAADPTVIIREVIVPNEGLFIIGSDATDNGDGTWHYEYAVFNLNSHLSGGSFSVPIEVNSSITNVGFRDVDYHSGEPFDGTDWAVDVDTSTGWVTWSTDDFATNANANALRWSTMYNFRFDADTPPPMEESVGSIGLFRPDGPPSVSVYLVAPRSNNIPLFADNFESGDLGAWVVFP